MRGHTDEELPTADWGSMARAFGGVGTLVALAFLTWRYPLVMFLVAALAVSFLMHELGHYLTARATGMKATDFYLGFGPRLWSFRLGETTYGLRALPLGAYVRIIGMYSNDPVEPGEERRAYRVKSYPRRALVISAGSLMHMLLALLTFVALNASLGAPAGNWQVAGVDAERDGVTMPAAAAGIEAGDRIVSVNGVDTAFWDDFVTEMRARNDTQVLLEIERGASTFATAVMLATDPETGNGQLGVRVERARFYETVGIGAAITRSVGDLGRAVVDSAIGLGRLVTNLGGVADRIVSAPGDPTANADLGNRPVSVVGLVDLASDSELGWSERALLFALVNVFVGVFNMVPIPPLDGGHLAVATYERLREFSSRGRYQVNPRALMRVSVVMFALLLVLGLGLVYLDIANPISL